MKKLSPFEDSRTHAPWSKPKADSLMSMLYIRNHAPKKQLRLYLFYGVMNLHVCKSDNRIGRVIILHHDLGAWQKEASCRILKAKSIISPSSRGKKSKIFTGVCLEIAQAVKTMIPKGCNVFLTILQDFLKPLFS